MNTIREDIHRLVAAQMDRTDHRIKDPLLCDYMADLSTLFTNLLHEETRYQAQQRGADGKTTFEEWHARNGHDSTKFVTVNTGGEPIGEAQGKNGFNQ